MTDCADHAAEIARLRRQLQRVADGLAAAAFDEKSSDAAWLRHAVLSLRPFIDYAGRRDVCEHGWICSHTFDDEGAEMVCLGPDGRGLMPPEGLETEAVTRP